MLLRRFYDPMLAQASYLVGCQRTGEAIVVDPNRDIGQYLDAAAAEGVRVTQVTETHIHADFVSGARALARRAGARLLLSAEGGAGWRYRFAEGDDARLLADGDRIDVGAVWLDVLHTPGHTPEHVVFVVTDTAATDRPMGALTGDFLFVGDVGRPDLLERAAGERGTMEAGARTLFRSLVRFRALPDHLQVWPGHGAGSACGKALGAIPSTTVGYEKIGNWGVRSEDEDEFVRAVLAGQPEPPRYFAEMKRINREGPRVLAGLPRPTRLPALALHGLLRKREVVVDTRPAEEYAAGHVPGTLNIPLNGSFTTWAGWLLPYDRDVYLIADDADHPDRVDEALRDLSLIGLDRVAGVFGTDAVTAWRSAGRTVGTVAQATPVEAETMLARGAAAVVDVRSRTEWDAGHLPGAPNIPVGYLAGRIAELPSDRTLIVTCQTGARSAIAASLLQSLGLANVVNLTGGFAAWRDAGLPVESAAPEDAGDALAAAR